MSRRDTWSILAIIVVVALIVLFVWPAWARTTTPATQVSTQSTSSGSDQPAPTQVAKQGTDGTQPAPQAKASGDVINLLDGRSMDPRTTVSDTQLGFPPYEDTGVGKSKSWKLSIPAGRTLIVGGVLVVKDGKRYDKGFIGAWEGPFDTSLTVNDGFYDVKSPSGDEARGNFCARVSEHRRNGWLLTEIQPVSGWASKCW